jgi:hypothetical protein
MKYADNIVKVFAACLALFLSTFLSWLFFAFKVHTLLLVGFVVAIISMYLYFGPHNAVLLAHEEKAAKDGNGSGTGERGSLLANKV